MATDIKTPEDFAAHHGQTPQEYFAATVTEDANPTRLAEWEADLAKAEAAVAATKGWEALKPSDPKYQAGADAENALTAAKQLVDGALYRQSYALAFLAGTLADYGPYAGAECQKLKKLGWIDTTVVPA